MATTFPSNPTNGQTYTVNGVTYIYVSSTGVWTTYQAGGGQVSSSTVATLQTTHITTGAVGTAGDITGQWTLIGASTLQATYADLAELYEADEQYDAGTVLILGGSKEVTESTNANDSRVIGVVSDSAAYVMNKDCPGIATCVALQGRVYVKVVGLVQKGDILVTSSVAGHAEVNNNAKSGTVIGKSLQDKITKDSMQIEVAVGRF
jgi:hypothetical protein